MKTLMIHDVRPAYFELGLDAYRLTFDDGLFSQYFYYPVLSDKTPVLTYFITSSFVRDGKARSVFAGDPIPFLDSADYMHKTMIRGEYEHFMNVEELRSLAEKENVRIGAHSHFHDVILTRTHPKKRKALSPWKLERFENDRVITKNDLSIRSRLAFQGYELRNGRLERRSGDEWEDYIKRDTEDCLDWFESKLGFLPHMYCFPFNEYSEKLISVLKTFGFKTFYGARAKGRKDIHERIDIDSLITQ